MFWAEFWVFLGKLPWTELLSGIIGAILGAFVGGWAAVHFQRKGDKKRQNQERQFELYKLLLDLDSKHFWIANASEARPVRVEVLEEYDRLSWRVADKLREADEMPEAEDILRLVFSYKIESEQARSELLSRILTSIGGRVNSRYQSIMSQIGQENSQLVSADPAAYSERRDLFVARMTSAHTKGD